MQLNSIQSNYSIPRVNNLKKQNASQQSFGMAYKIPKKTLNYLGGIAVTDKEKQAGLCALQDLIEKVESLKTMVTIKKAMFSDSLNVKIANKNSIGGSFCEKIKRVPINDVDTFNSIGDRAVNVDNAYKKFNAVCGKKAVERDLTAMDNSINKFLQSTQQ